MTEQDSPVAEVDAVVRGLLPGYLGRRREEIGRLRTLVEQEDFTEVRVIGHNLAGSGGAYGLPQLTEIGREIEAAASKRDSDAILAQLEAMEVFVERVSAQLD